MPALEPVTPAQFFAEMFASRAYRDGAVIRRKVRLVEKYVGRELFCAEMRRRGFAVVENAGQFVVFCNAEPVRRVV